METEESQVISELIDEIGAFIEVKENGVEEAAQPQMEEAQTQVNKVQAQVNEAQDLVDEEQVQIQVDETQTQVDEIQALVDKIQAQVDEEQAQVNDAQVQVDEAQAQVDEPAEDKMDEEFIVERIMDKKIDERGFVKYLVKWEGYPASSNTWEPLENLVECDKALQAYEIKQAQRISKSQAGLEDGTKKRVNSKLKQHTVNDIIGITLVDNERFFLVSLLNSSRSTFVRASLANKMFPEKVIDFYLKHLQWKQKSD